MNSRSLHSAPPDFLWNVVALMHFMRPSLRKGAQVDLSSAAWQEIQVRSGRDDTSFWVLGYLCLSNQVAARKHSQEGSAEQQIPPLRSG
jgi:hypothetical protein